MGTLIKKKHKVTKWMKISIDGKKITYEQKDYDCSCSIDTDHCDLKPHGQKATK